MDIKYGDYSKSAARAKTARQQTERTGNIAASVPLTLADSVIIWAIWPG